MSRSENITYCSSIGFLFQYMIWSSGRAQTSDCFVTELLELP